MPEPGLGQTGLAGQAIVVDPMPFEDFVADNIRISRRVPGQQDFVDQSVGLDVDRRIGRCQVGIDDPESVNRDVVAGGVNIPSSKANLQGVQFLLQSPYPVNRDLSLIRAGEEINPHRIAVINGNQRHSPVGMDVSQPVNPGPVPGIADPQALVGGILETAVRTAVDTPVPDTRKGERLVIFFH